MSPRPGDWKLGGGRERERERVTTESSLLLLLTLCLCNRYGQLEPGESSLVSPVWWWWWWWQTEADNVTAGCSVLTDLLVLTHTVYELELGRKAEDRTWSPPPHLSTSPHTTTTTTQQSQQAQFSLFSVAPSRVVNLISHKIEYFWEHNTVMDFIFKVNLFLFKFYLTF